MSNTDIIATAFDIGPLVEPGVVSKMMITNEQLNVQPVSKPTPEHIIKDFNQARQNIMDVIDTAKDAIENVSDLALQSQDNKYYDSLTSTMKVMLEANRDLIDMHQKIKKLTEDIPVPKPNQVQNNLFVGSTAELTKFLADLKKKE